MPDSSFFRIHSILLSSYEKFKHGLIEPNASIKRHKKRIEKKHFFGPLFAHLLI